MEILMRTVGVGAREKTHAGKTDSHGEKKIRSWEKELGCQAAADRDQDGLQDGVGLEVGVDDHDDVVPEEDEDDARRS
eukprot:CAMPEP_0197413666 /NCGR_PEP_ID=MMETSP1170-20131217/515_1 /TAXON_ID=54406 /ORGANISM="Sarcinochrysis sp, Strain CCMP770" /LENGTH=77 /DNA_ID=CAMNT_0042940281 /DNA_START=336 /DNA_END=569 /DNA_ORIENTATION=-